MAAILRETIFSPYRELEDYQQRQTWNHGKFGATSVFIGTMRDFNLGDSITRMVLEFYPGMTENRLQKVIQEASEQWGILDCLVIHRVGEIAPNDTIVLIAVWAIHRTEAIEACRYIIEALKHTVPFWKKESLFDGERWVETNT